MFLPVRKLKGTNAYAKSMRPNNCIMDWNVRSKGDLNEKKGNTK